MAIVSTNLAVGTLQSGTFSVLVSNSFVSGILQFFSMYEGKVFGLALQTFKCFFNLLTKQVLK